MKIPDGMWLAGNADYSVTIVCDYEDCRPTNVGEPAGWELARYGGAELPGRTWFDMDRLGEFLAFVQDHADLHRNYDTDEPCWVPLRTLVPAGERGAWMWMGRGDHNGQPVEFYKHASTRGSIALTRDGRAWRSVVVQEWCWTPWGCAIPDQSPSHECSNDGVREYREVPAAEALAEALR
ncbi:hypothetical protein [Catenuloplanes indicus]|uniref:Uncharacterized protein n=1 Tax=Catenuloplanes indicus TaxID=137267 RepID=A0AAE4B1K9_9ACTN|nr:hypothetical protein [Catenuloplanes indicus]MDQ0371550.1 hypothetical protein [Catenuloplanes indicus]